MSDRFGVVNWVGGLAGAAVGGALGYLAFVWLLRQGFYAMILPGALVGLGAGLLSRGKSLPLGIACGAAGLALGILAQWRFFPFAVDDGFSYFLAHVHQLRPLTLVMIALGALFAFWFGIGRQGGVWKRPTESR